MSDPEIISRRAAADSGKTFFFTGKACKHGHVSQRYVTTGACKACLMGNFKPKRNPWSTLFVPYTNPNLWALRTLTREQRIAQRVYIQRCLFEFARTQLASLPLTSRAEAEAAMLDMEERIKWHTGDNPLLTD